ncbi:DUF397 domain-containing protein [[Kitasatospora] papulosa]|uniref:DUF397 domain-containing protein n=1 Tax=Streptomyces TaxID=1883 RepID=UPI0025B4E31F|nr:DUF397 domain-containing protein [Streptomyces sp. P9-2B-1]WJY35433.1 DUF397 domain-containing protein [Streptomyces sp. P9-2B-1]
MKRTVNGISAGSLQDVQWVKSRASTAVGDCVELAALPGGEVAVRNSRDPLGPSLVYTQQEIAAFLDGARNGEFDHLV